jgi:hypothetical protein
MSEGALEIENSRAQVIEGEFINIKQSSIRSVEGGHVEMQRCVLTVDGERLMLCKALQVL